MPRNPRQRQATAERKCRSPWQWNDVLVYSGIFVLVFLQISQSGTFRRIAYVTLSELESQLAGGESLLSNLTTTIISTSLAGESSTAVKEERPSSSSSTRTGLVIDLLATGSKVRPHYMVAQRESLGSHVSVRHYFNATEDDDDDLQCNKELTSEDAFAISSFCHRGQSYRSPQNYFLLYMRNNFAAKPWLLTKGDPAGWMCAQRRPVHGLYKVFKEYRDNGVELPDHLILMDDDTYLNLEQFEALYLDNTPELPLVIPGCLVRSPIHIINFTFPFGGFGTIFNRAALQVLMKPIECPRDEEVCARIQENQIFEASVFRNGMALIDLMQAYVSQQPYGDYAKGKWTTGYCLHSDWAIGYFINYYNITRHSESDPAFLPVANDRLEYFHGSSIYKRPEGFCKNSGVDNCQPESFTCHYITPSAMRNYTKVMKQNYPNRFRDIVSSKS